MIWWNARRPPGMADPHADTKECSDEVDFQSSHATIPMGTDTSSYVPPSSSVRTRRAHTPV
jgi:hypothetical protein